MTASDTTSEYTGAASATISVSPTGDERRAERAMRRPPQVGICQRAIRADARHPVRPKPRHDVPHRDQEQAEVTPTMRAAIVGR